MWVRRIGMGAVIVILAALAVVAFGIQRGTPMKLVLFQILSLEAGMPAPLPTDTERRRPLPVSGSSPPSAMMVSNSSCARSRTSLPRNSGRCSSR
jgi:hypothetical protein